MMSLIRDKIERWNFDKKMKVFMSVAIIISAMTILIISTISAAKTITEKSKYLAQIQIETITSQIDHMLEDYKATAVAVIMDTKIQDYLTSTETSVNEVTKLANDASNTLLSIVNLQPNTNFLAVVKKDASSYLYRGGISIATTRFSGVYENDYMNSTSTGYGNMKMSFNNAFYDGRNYSLNIYHPIYNLTSIGSEIGLLCINIDEEIFDMKSDNKEYLNLELIDIKGNIITDSEKSEIEKKFNFLSNINGISGSFNEGGSLYVYQRVGDWDYYIVESIPLVELYKESVNMFVILAFFIIVMVIICLYVISKMISKAYLPMDQLITKMENVSKGRLDIRFNTEKVGDDFRKTANGFNYMMNQINDLMDQVRAEQRQIEQIRFNALQAQISPHFLYNTLECIHWQAVADKNQVISKLVKALATFYRLCLSNGNDIIPLAQELEHVKSYLIIQNTRFGDIIESHFDIPQKLLQVMIPKMTLQPLVENSIYHGIKAKEGNKGELIITAKNKEGFTIITIEDNGIGMLQKQLDEMNLSISVFDETFGYGVRNVNKRIELLFGTQYGLHYSKSDTNGVKVEIKLPIDNKGGTSDI